MTGRVRVESDGTPPGTAVYVDGILLDGVVEARVVLRGDDTPRVVLTLDYVDLDIRTPYGPGCGAVHPETVEVCVYPTGHSRNPTAPVAFHLARSGRRWLA